VYFVEGPFDRELRGNLELFHRVLEGSSPVLVEMKNNVEMLPTQSGETSVLYAVDKLSLVS
jgi:hypothetical protein